MTLDGNVRIRAHLALRAKISYFETDPNFICTAEKLSPYLERLECDFGISAGKSKTTKTLKTRRAAFLHERCTAEVGLTGWKIRISCKDSEITSFSKDRIIMNGKM